MPFLLNFAFLFLISKFAFAELDSPINYEHTDASLVSIFQEASLGENTYLDFEGVFGNSGLSDDDLFVVEDGFTDLDLPDDSVWNNDMVSSCSDDNNWELSKIRARQASCPAIPSTAPVIPEMPGWSDIEKAISVPDMEILTTAGEPIRPDKPYLVIGVGEHGVSVAADEPEYYCHVYVSRFRPFLIPVCSDMTHPEPLIIYNEIHPATLRRFFLFSRNISKHV
jgi:hypothetical protein